MRNFKNILTMVVGSLSILFYTQIGSATDVDGTSKAAAGITDRAGSITDGGDHSALARIFLLCDQGVASTGVQECQIYAQVLGGVTGVISDESFSTISLTAAGTISTSTGFYGSSKDISTSTSVSESKGVTENLVAVTGTAPSAGFALSTDPVVNISALTGNSDQQDNSATWTSTADPTGDLCRAFKSNAKADGYKTDTAYTAASDIIATKLAASSDNDALFLLQGFMGTTFNRNSIGYAETFTVPYTITVESNLAKTDASCTGS